MIILVLKKRVRNVRLLQVKKISKLRKKENVYDICSVDANSNFVANNIVVHNCDLFGRGRGAIYVKDKNPVQDSWRLKAFEKIGSYNEFTPIHTILDKLKRHPNFWMSIKFPKPPEWLYNRYLAAREKNVYDSEDIMGAVSKEDVYKALLVLSLRDIMQHDNTLSINRILLHIKNEYDIPLTKQMIEEAIDDSKQLVVALREKFNMSIADLKDGR